MSDQQQVRLQIFVGEPLRRRLKVKAASLAIDMSDLGRAILQHSLEAIESGEVPPELAKLIEAEQKAKVERDAK